MAEAIASISEARNQLKRQRRRRSQSDLAISEDDNVVESDASGSAPVDSNTSTTSDRDIVDDIIDSENALRGRDRSLLRSGPYPVTDPQNQNLVEK